jgi:hypothetical protein
MTAAEFKIAFETLFYAATTVNSLGWSDNEINNFLNYAQNSIVISLVETQNLEAISNLIKVGVVNTIPLETNNEIQLALNLPNYYIFIDGDVMIGSDRYPLEKIGVNSIEHYKVSKFNNATYRKPKIAIDGSGTIPVAIILKGGFISGTITEFNYRFLEKPTQINIGTNTTTNLNVTLHDKIVGVAVAKAVESFIKTGQSTQ